MSPSQIKLIVEKSSGIEDIAIFSRKRYIVDVRVCYYELCRLFDPKYTQDRTASILGRNHATVLSALKNFKNLYGVIYNNGEPAFLANGVFNECKDTIKRLMSLGTANQFYLGVDNKKTIFQIGDNRVAVFKRAYLAKTVCKLLNETIL